MARQLRPVAPEERAEKKPPATVADAAKGGDARELLVTMRDRIAVAVTDPNTPARDLAALTKRLMEVVRDIEAIDAREEQESTRGDVADGEFDASAI